MLDAFSGRPLALVVLVAPGDPVTDEARHRPFQPPIQERLDLVREYIEAPWWRRVLSSSDAYDPADADLLIFSSLPYTLFSLRLGFVFVQRRSRVRWHRLEAVSGA